MVHIKSFKALRPVEKYVRDVAALPYDVYDEDEARREAASHPMSFLRIDRPETAFPEGCDMYAKEVYDKAAELLSEDIKKGIYIREEEPCLYLYALTMNGRTQTGLATCVSVDDYLNGNVKKHENTVREKEEDRVRHITALNAQTGPIFLTYRKNDRLKDIFSNERKKKPLYSFISEDGIEHELWRISDAETIGEITGIFSEEISSAYIADGHHRAASAVRASLKRREAEGPTGETDTSAEYNYFLSVLFPDDELKILDYNRVVRDKGGLSDKEILAGLSESFEISESCPELWRPEKKGDIGMYLSDSGKYYRLSIKGCEYEKRSADPVARLDASLLQELVLSRIFTINDPRTDKRVEFVGGIKGDKILKEKADLYGGVAFLMYPTSISELMDVADAGLLMPPKSTWFEPKLRSGLLIHEF